MAARKVFIHIVTWNSAESIVPCIVRAAAQEGFTLGEDLWIRITDNGSIDSTKDQIVPLIRTGIELHENAVNLGFCGGHNQGIGAFLGGDWDSMLILNPDVGLEPTTLRTMLSHLDDAKRIGIVTPKLLRALPSLEAIHPHVLDAAGMMLTSACRHFDRGAGAWDQGQFDTPGFVFGATGACVLLSRRCVEALCLPNSISDEPVFAIYPQLRAGSTERPKLFDEAFFAYREDADLSWRAGRLGWKCWYEPTAVAHHVRVVTPERRGSLPPTINAWSVRNRFLLQLNNWGWSQGILFFVHGIVIRNLVVVIGVVLSERSSIHALREVCRLAPRARSIRGWIQERAARD